MKYIIANWKAHKTLLEAKAWVQDFQRSGMMSELAAVENNLTVVLCVPFLHMPVIHELLPEMQLGVQTLSPYGDGAYTGAISARMVADIAHFALLGHVERRQYFGETDQVVAQQVIQAVDNEMIPIVAVDGKNWSSRLSLLEKEQVKESLVMYEPAEAISSTGGKAADLDEVVKAAQLIRSEYPVKAVLYGGSVDHQNVGQYLSADGVAGVVPGAASLDVEKFVHLLRAAIAAAA